MFPALPSDALADALLDSLARPIVFVDLETTGGNATTDRVTEIGVVEVSRAGIERWSVLVDPGTPVPPFIEKLTGISDAMLQGQPTFASLAEALIERLAGKLFVAHNARFDYGFLKNEFRRAGLAFRADVLCTVRLSRALFPSVQRHGLDSLIARFGLAPEGRHRALADADLLWQFWQKIHELYSQDLVDAAIKTLIRRAALPAALPESALDELPTTTGVYVFHGDDDLPLYVGKSINLKDRVMAHFSGDHRLAKDLAISQAIRRIECRETVGELGALLLEAKLVKDLQPVHNRLLRRADATCAWQWLPGAHAPVLIHAKKRDFSREADLFGIYQSRAKAQAHLRRLADEHNLCHATLGLEKIPPGSARGCFGYQVRRCQGACVGAETLAGHTARVHEALAASRVVEWPHAGPIAIAERDANSGRVAWHVIDHWCYLGLCRSIEGIGPLVANAGEMRAFDFDVYGLISRRLVSGELEWIACDVRPCFSLALQQAPRFADHAIPMRRNSSGKRNLQAIPDAAQYALSFA
ncbi:DNA polymerase/helicase [Caballeronia arationis]|jgi:DNA polymerase-3 subunit epsilon|uniref:DNA-directed DNA polymerase n=1 Tax=Caballeronia arationis TaxID=1777142 RepID=A0A7Z7IC98_9BURK|nr:3'-5' exonuclease family protein [Caballeronia arationis]SAL04616.1 DNA polymerase/helicase [Caballeronia arationis]SOE88095.1 exonuclease, DNA polymerase III, epsilon subunit family [Caballeronia arationis]